MDECAPARPVPKCFSVRSSPSSVRIEVGRGRDDAPPWVARVSGSVSGLTVSAFGESAAVAVRAALRGLHGLVEAMVSMSEGEGSDG